MDALCIDYGNTLVKMAVMGRGGNMEEELAVPHNEATAAVTDLCARHNIKHAIVSMVTNVPEEDLAAWKENVELLVLNDRTHVPVSNAYHSPGTLGTDRLAAVVAANAAFPDKANLVITLGTCITYNLITQNRAFRGGAISPGLHMRLKAMAHFTGQLPEISMDGHLQLLGYDTETCLRSGAFYGMAAEIHGMIQAYKNDNPTLNAVLTGGDAALFAPQLKNQIFADPALVLKGLYIILAHNVPILH